MRPLLSTSAFLFWLGFSVTNGFDTDLRDVKSFENKAANALLNQQDISENLNRQVLPYGQTANKYQQALKRKATLGAKWLDNLNEESPLDKEESSFFINEKKRLINSQSYDSEYDKSPKDKSRWSDYIIEKKELPELDS